MQLCRVRGPSRLHIISRMVKKCFLLTSLLLGFAIGLAAQLSPHGDGRIMKRYPLDEIRFREAQDRFRSLRIE